MQEIAEIVGLNRKTVRVYMNQMGLRVSKTTPKTERFDQIRQLISEGAESTGEIAEKMGLSYRTIKNYASLGSIQLPKKK